MHYFFYILIVFAACCSNAVFLECMTKTQPGCANLVTLIQFAFITVKGIVTEAKFGTKKPKIPLKNYVTLVLMFFITSILSNYALKFNIPMPLHMIFKSGSLISTMVLGMIIMKRRYKTREYLSILMVTIGIFICTYYSAKNVIKSKPQHSNNSDLLNESSLSNYTWWLIGLLLMTVSLFVGSGMGIVQEKLYATYGKHPDEALFYIHFMTLPFFVILYGDITSHISLFNESMPINILFVEIPIMWLYLIGNILTQYICISSVFVLSTECSSLVVQLITALRKFISLIISIAYFGNPFTSWHWFGTFLVFTGTLWFTNIVKLAKDYYFAKEKKEN